MAPIERAEDGHEYEEDAGQAIGSGGAKPRTQEEADMALARALQEQERAYYILRQQSLAGSLGSRDTASEDDDQEYEDYDDEGADAQRFGEDGGEDGVGGESAREGGEELAGTQLDGAQYDDDEAFARALQEAEDRETTARMMALAGINPHDPEDPEGYDSGSEDSQGMWRDAADPDNMSYEELVALGEVVGTESKGLQAAVIAALPASTYKHGDRRLSSSGQEQCVICRVEYEDGEGLLTLPCRHHYHTPCIQQWLANNKTCPMCTKEITVAQRPPSANGTL